MSKFGLGRGLADLKAEMGVIPDISVLTGAERIVVKHVPLNQIRANPNQARKNFSDRDLNDLAASIKEKGVLQPILLRTVKDKPYMYEIIAGERRFRAGKLAGLKEIPSLIKNLSDNNSMEISLIENVQRENLNPIEEAVAYKNLMENCGYELSDISKLIGKSESYIRNLMRLNNLPESVKLLVEQGELSLSHARTIAVARDPAKLAYEIIRKKLSVADTEKKVKNSTRSAGSRAYMVKTIDSQTAKDIEKRITSALKVPAKLREKKGGAGQIILFFATRLQMKELIDKLLGK